MSKSALVPGPGKYETPSKLGEGPKYFIGQKLEDRSLIKKALAVPAPDQYEPNF
jgi:hypothetical protein